MIKYKIEDLGDWKITKLLQRANFLLCYNDIKCTCEFCELNLPIILLISTNLIQGSSLDVS